MTTLVYDGDCGFCTTSVRFLHRHIRTSATVVAWQDCDLATLGLTTAQAQDKVQWVAADGTISAGHAAVGRLLLDAGGPWRIPGRIAVTPPFCWLARGIYRLISDNRHRLPGGTPACALPADQRPGATGSPGAGSPGSPGAAG